MKAKTRVAVTLGDPGGVGPEVVAAALADPRVQALIEPLVLGDLRILELAASLRRVPVPAARQVSGPLSERPTQRELGAASLAYVDAGIEAVLSGEASALCTAPLSKHRVSLAAPGFQGHTEHLALRTGARVAMMMAGPRLRVVLATNHLALRDVPFVLTPEQLTFVIVLSARELRERFAIEAPRIAVCGLNPHAGDGGLFGDEEARLIAPAIEDARRQGVQVSGPLAADGLFPRAAAGACDAVVALYHDQGLIPAKLLDFRETVNVTLGLPFARTSPDHGTADDLAGLGTADAEPMVSALLLAARLGQEGRG